MVQTSNQGKKSNKNIKKNSSCERFKLHTKNKGKTRTSWKAIIAQGLNFEQEKENNKNIKKE